MEHPVPLPRAWLRTTLDALVLFEAAHRGLVRVYTHLPPIEERKALMFNGSLIVFNKTAARANRWGDGHKWSQSRQILSYMVRWGALLPSLFFAHSPLSGLPPNERVAFPQ